MLFDMLRTTNSSIKGLWLNENRQIDDKCMKSLGEYIKSNKSIERVDIGTTQISDAGIEILAPYLDDNTTFKYLSISYNKGITDKAIPLLLRMIESSHIEYINVNYTSITQKSILTIPLAQNTLKYGSTKLNIRNK